jgi:outer membrane protein OmpA-like peptidoglycan-associated protein
MSVNLIELAKNYLSSEIMNKISGEIGERPERVEQAMEAGIPSILAGFLNMATSSGGNRLVEMLKQTPSELSHLGGLDKVLSNPGALFSGGSIETVIKYGQTLLNFLFGGKLSSITDLISRTSGIKTSSASSLLGMLAPLVMGMLRKETASDGFSLASLTKLLTDQKGAISRLAPPGLSDALGLKSLNDLGAMADSIKAAGTGAARAVGRTAGAAATQGSDFLRWAAPLALLALVVGGLIYYFSTQPVQRADSEAAPNLAQAGRTALDAGKNTIDRAAQSVKDTGRALTDQGKTLVETSMKLVPTTLPGNVKIDLPENSYLQDLIKSLKETAASATASAKSLVADDLKFDDSTAKLSADSSTATSRLATILKAFGTAKLKIEGHTDNVGDPGENKKTSLARANAVKDALVDAGVPADRITTAGAGAEGAIASNDTEEGRAKNRRIELSIVAK